jgi:hypothetical protein
VSFDSTYQIAFFVGKGKGTWRKIVSFFFFFTWHFGAMKLSRSSLCDPSLPISSPRFELLSRLAFRLER